MNFEQCVLVGSTVRTYLAWLKDTGGLTVLFENNQLLWQRTQQRRRRRSLPSMGSFAVSENRVGRLRRGVPFLKNFPRPARIVCWGLTLRSL